MNDKIPQEMNRSGNQIPDQEQIEVLLGKIAPQPTSRFHDRIALQPWNKEISSKRIFKNPLIKPLPVTLAIAVILILIVSLATPSLGALANRIARFFTTSNNDQVYIQVPVEVLTNFEHRYALSISEAETLSGYEIKTPAYMTDNFDFNGAGYDSDRQAVTLRYKNLEGSILLITQRPIGIEYQSISVNAMVESVQIGPVMGEYVVGGWQAVQTSQEDNGFGLTVTLQAEWNPDSDIQFLRWRLNEMLYEIIYTGKTSDSHDDISKEDLIAIAESMQ